MFSLLIAVWILLLNKKLSKRFKSNISINVLPISLAFGVETHK